jgi:hypothetical protein
MDAYKDPSSPGNGKRYRTEKKCIVEGCNELAGTAWGKYWCFKHNVERIDGIGKSLEKICASLNGKEKEHE